MENQSKQQKYKRQKMTLLLDGETIELLKEYGMKTTGSESVSAAVRTMAKEYGRRSKRDE